MPLKDILKLKIITYDGLNSTVNNLKSNQENYFQFDANGLRIGKKNNPYQVVIDNEKYYDFRCYRFYWSTNC